MSGCISSLYSSQESREIFGSRPLTFQVAANTLCNEGKKWERERKKRNEREGNAFYDNDFVVVNSDSRSLSIFFTNSSFSLMALVSVALSISSYYYCRWCWQCCSLVGGWWFVFSLLFFFLLFLFLSSLFKY